MFGHNGALDIPTKSKADNKAVEIARVWAAGGAMEVSLRVATQKDPAAWGIILVDLAKHIANTYQQADGRNHAEVLARIRAGIDAEWSSATDVPTGKIG
jgi:pyrimidine deaminase RibD-like protein